MKSIEIYTPSNGDTQIHVQFEKDTVWLNLNQIAELFGRDKSVISRHFNNIFKEGELDRVSTVAKNATVQQEGNREVSREVEYYNLDAILSVGYRVNSKQGTQFRIWASQRLKEYLLDGVSINTKRLQDLDRIVNIIESANSTQVNELSETKGLLNILKNYTKSFILLNQYDSSTLKLNDLEENIIYEIDYEEALNAIAVVKSDLIEKNEATELFGNQKDKTFQGTLKSIVQTFDSQYLYPSIEEQASNLLYFIIKNHPFTDGNKRIGAFIFVWFLEKNKHLLKKNGEKKINDNALTALALLIAQSNPSDKELMIKLICNLITN